VPLLLALLAILAAFAAPGEGLAWTRDPGLVPWETMTTSGDPARQPARTQADLTARRALVKATLDRGGLSRSDRAAALVELGDLFRDEARMVLEQDAADPWRIPLRTSPAWLQLELAARRYREALDLDPQSVDAEGRLTLLQAVIATRLGRDDRFEDYVRVIRSYRGTPYVEMAKLAVGDHHFRAGDLSRARSAYRMVREARDPELASYARYRMASIHAAQGEHDQAKELLTQILDRREPGPLLAMLRDAARSALANQLARELPLIDLIRWLDRACPAQDQACRRDVREAAADTCAAIGDDRGDAWLRTVDDVATLADDLDARLDLARRMLADEPVIDVLFAAEDACGDQHDSCRADQAHAVMQFYDRTADPDGTWLPAYLRLPRLPGRPEVQRLAAELARAPRPPAQELAAFEGVCAAQDTACAGTMRVHLRAIYSRLDRLHDAAWMHFVDEGLPAPGDRRIATRGRELVRARAPARDLLATFERACDDPACRDELFEVLVGYYVAIGVEEQAAWLYAIKTLPSLPIPQERRQVLLDAALRGDGALPTLRAVLATCPAPTPRCFDESRVATETFFRVAARHADAGQIARLALLTERALDPVTFPVMVSATLDDPPVAETLRAIDEVCTGRADTCAPTARATLADWYELLDRYADRLVVTRIDAPPELGAWQRLGPAFLRVVRTATDPREAAAKVAALCPFGSAECPVALREALAAWYETQGRLDDARVVRAVLRGGGFVLPR